MSPITIGPFEIQERIGKGGMGEVWRGVHRDQKVPVAIKVITRARAKKPKYLRAFRDEVQAVARLNHPGIVMVFDYGTISQQAAEASEGVLTAQSPYLVMESASNTLRALPRPVPWSRLKPMLLALLDALAHSHARGVIHRDLKPANVLLASIVDTRPGLKLTDFGIAHALSDQSGAGADRMSTGTPLYMPSEQFRGEWRDFGPWTDLYALGCLAYQLATDEAPFKGQDWRTLADAHCFEQPPRLRSNNPLPKEFEGWILRLLQKAPGQRFQRAADAAEALVSMSHPVTSDTNKRASVRKASTNRSSAELTTITEYNTVSLDGKLSEITARRRRERPSWDSGVEHDVPLCPIPAPRVPENWERQDTLPTIQLLGVGLGLFGLRPIPMVNRTSEFDSIWGALQQAHTAGRPQLVHLHGGAGHGKSRIAEWICQRADELGAATVLRANHEVNCGPSDGLPRMIARSFRCVHLSRENVLTRTGRVLNELGVNSPYEQHALTELIAPATESQRNEPGHCVRFEHAAQRYAVVTGYLERLARERPLVLWLDDVQWGGDSLAFVEYLLDDTGDLLLPVLVLVTSCDDLIHDRPTEQRRLKRLLKHPDANDVLVGPLASSHQSELIRNLLHLNEGLVRDLDNRTEGNPLFAIQLAGDWVRRGVLHIGPDGFSLARGERALLPKDIQSVWAQRVVGVVDETINAHPDADRQHVNAALELAGALGRTVDNEEWEAVCERAEIRLPDRLHELLINHRLARPSEGGWAFIHGLLRESLEKTAKEGSRWQYLNHCCADALELRSPNDQPGTWERIACHRIEAKQAKKALQPLRLGALERRSQSDFDAALGLLQQLEGCLDSLDSAPLDIRRLETWLLRGKVLLKRNKFDSASKWIEQTREGAESVADDNLLGRSLQLSASISQWRGDTGSAKALLERAIKILRRCQAHREVALCLRQLAETVRHMGQLKSALTLLDEAEQLARRVGDTSTVSLTQRTVGKVSIELKDYPRAITLLEDVLRQSDQVGDRHAVADILNDLGEVYRLTGDLTAAEKRYREALELFKSIGSESDCLVPQFNLATMLVTRRKFGEGQEIFERLAKTCQRRGILGLLALVHCCLLPCKASREDWAQWDDHFSQASRLLDETGVVEPDGARSLVLAGDLADIAGEDRRARRAFELALTLYTKLDYQTEMEDVSAKLNR